jgi:hypothetical protein
MSANGLKGPEAGKALGDAIAASALKELDISGGKYNSQKCDVEFVQTFSVGLRDNRALSFLDISNNGIGEWVQPSGWKDTCGDDDWELDTRYQHTDGTKQWNEPGKLPEGAIAIANAIKDMGALTSLNLSSNNLKAEGGKIVAEAIKVTNNAMGVVLVQFSCPSDHWFDCCCLLLSIG